MQIEKVVSLIHCADSVLEMSHPNECLLTILGVSIGVVLLQSLELALGWFSFNPWSENVVWHSRFT